MANTANNQSGNPSRQLTSSLDAQQEKLDAISTLAKDQILVLKDILDVMKNIADNMAAGLRAQNIIYAVQPDANRLAEAEKEREANRQNVPGKNDPFKSMRDVFDSLKKAFDFVKVLLIPMMIGFLIGFRKKFDLLTIAIGAAILWPIRTFKLMVSLFKGIISFAKNLGPNIEYARRQLSIGFRILANAFNRSIITRLSNQLISGIQGFFSRIVSRFANVTGITNQLNRVSKFFFHVKTLFNSMTAPINDVRRANAALGKFGAMIQQIGNSFNRTRMGLNPAVNRFMAAVQGAKNFFLGIGQRISSIFSSVSSIFSRVMTAIKPITDFMKAVFEPITKLFRAGSGAAGLMNNPAMKFLFKIAGKGLKAVPILGQIIMIVEGLMGFVKGGIKGYEEGGIIGMIKGALSGLIDGLFGWIFDLVGWVAGMLGFEDAEKALDEYGLGDMVNDLLGFIFDPIEKVFGIIGDMFSGEIGVVDGILKLFKTFLDGIIAFPKLLLEGIAVVFGLDAIAAIIKDFSFYDILENIYNAVKDWLSGITDWLFGGDDDEKAEPPTPDAKTPTPDAKNPTPEDAENAVSAAEKKLNRAKSSGGDVEAAQRELEAAKANLDKAKKTTPTPADTSKQVGDQQKLDAATEEKQKLAAAPPKPPQVSSPVAIAVDNSSKQAVTYSKEIRATKDRGAPGNLPGRRNDPY